MNELQMIFTLYIYECNMYVCMHKCMCASYPYSMLNVYVYVCMHVCMHDELSKKNKNVRFQLCLHVCMYVCRIRPLRLVWQLRSNPMVASTPTRRSHHASEKLG